MEVITAEIINPSDAYTISGRKDAVVAATMIVGGGKYGLRGPDGEDYCPPFIFGGAEAWFEQQFGCSLRDWMGQNREVLAEALESVLIGGFGDRVEFRRAIELMPEEARAGFRAERHDKRRSSMNDIGGRAAQFAKAVRQMLAEQAVA